MKEIGGYFELELPNNSSQYHTDYDLFLTNGRAALHYILKQTKAKKVYLPFFACHVLLEPIELLNLEYEFLTINENLELKSPPFLKEYELLIYINYFGVKNTYTDELSIQYKQQLIVDNTHNFFFIPSPTRFAWYFNSCRKFFGVPDGAYLYKPTNCSCTPLKIQPNQVSRAEHLFERMNGRTSAGYPKFITYEQNFGSELIAGSQITLRQLSIIDLQQIRQQRKDNFYYLHSKLTKSNLLSQIWDNDIPEHPFSYPYLPNKEIKHQLMWQQNIFTPILWKECTQVEENSLFLTAKKIATRTLHLPIDHRYGKSEMDFMIKKLKQFEKK